MIYDLIIIGAGPAGISAAIYAARQKLNLLVISRDMGGQLGKKSVDIENYPGFSKISGQDLIARLLAQLEENKVETVFDSVISIKKEENKFLIATETGANYESLAVIATSGAEPKKLGVEGEKEFAGKGVSYCALCDGPIFRGKTVAVAGGGNSGFETALFLSNYVKEIFILESEPVPRADKENQDLVMKSGKVKIITNVKVKKIAGDNFVKEIIYETLKGQEKLEVSGVFVEIGYAPETAFLNGLIDLTERGEIIFNLENLETKTAGLFSAGDANKGKYKQIIISCGEGAKAALSAYEYIQKAKK
ncbi:MAG: FAD-dependent oxidoreductase [Patescibacteria group bacterium]